LDNGDLDNGDVSGRELLQHRQRFPVLTLSVTFLLPFVKIES